MFVSGADSGFVVRMTNAYLCNRHTNWAVRVGVRYVVINAQKSENF